MTAKSATPPPPLAHAISGSLGSALAILLLYPLERVRIELQSSASASIDHQNAGDDPEEQHCADGHSPKSSASSESWVSCNEELEVSNHTVPSRAAPSEARQETLLACLLRLHSRGDMYRGVGPVVSTLAASNFVFFFMHQAVKRFLGKRKSAWRALAASTLAGIVNVLITNPLWVANLRIVQGSNNKSLLREVHAIYKSEGPASLWNGTTTSLLLVSNPVIQFFCYEQLKQMLIRRRQGRQRLTPLEAFILGALAKALSTVATYPLQLAQVLLRLQDSSDQNYSGTMGCLRHLAEEKGLSALFTGLKAKLLQTCMTAALTFLSYEQILSAVQSTIFEE